LFPSISTWKLLAEANLIIHFLEILSRMPLAEANLEIHFPVILLRMPLAEVNLVNTPDFVYIKHNLIVIVFIRKTLNYIIVKER
jgi:hypothetical protein